MYGHARTGARTGRRKGPKKAPETGSNLLLESLLVPSRRARTVFPRRKNRRKNGLRCKSNNILMLNRCTTPVQRQEATKNRPLTSLKLSLSARQAEGKQASPRRGETCPVRHFRLPGRLFPDRQPASPRFAVFHDVGSPV